MPDAGTVDSCRAPTSSLSDFEALARVLSCLRDRSRTPQGHRAAIDAFIWAVEEGGGFPIVEGGRATFVYVRSSEWDAEDDVGPGEDFDPSRRLDPIRVAGDLNDWATNSESMATESEGFLHLTLTLPEAGERLRYKFVARDGSGADVWFSDPLSRRFDFDQNGRLSIVRGGASRGHLEWIRAVHATRLDEARNIFLYVPKGYDDGSARLPVLYMHDGQNLFDPAQPDSAPWSWEADAVAEAEISAGRARPFLIVGVPNNSNRWGEYTQVSDRWDGQLLGGDAAAYGHFVFTELKPLIDRRYRTLAGREQTAVLGSSLGGLVSYYLGYEYHHLIKYVGGMSSVFDWGRLGMGNPTVLDLYAGAADLGSRDQVFYLDSGGGPPPGGRCVSDGMDDVGDGYCVTLERKGILESKGFDTYPLDPDAARMEPEGVEILHWHQPWAPHNEPAWNARLHRVFRLFFRP